VGVLCSVEIAPWKEVDADYTIDCGCVEVASDIVSSVSLVWWCAGEAVSTCRLQPDGWSGQWEIATGLKTLSW
jgi:hypothetical protein